MSELNSNRLLTRIHVYRRVIAQGFWTKFGKIEASEILDIEPEQFMLDTFTDEFRAYHSSYEGYGRPSTYEHCKNLECCAVWDAPHVEERLNAHFFGMKCCWPITAAEHMKENRRRRKLLEKQTRGTV